MGLHNPRLGSLIIDSLEYRRFVCSILGPKGDAKTPPRKPSDVTDQCFSPLNDLAVFLFQVDYVFKGTTDIVRRCSDFFEAMQEHFQAHPFWKGWFA